MCGEEEKKGYTVLLTFNMSFNTNSSGVWA